MTHTNTTPDAEDQPGYDGPTYDSADRLRMWMDKSVPPADRDRLIAEYRNQVLTEAAELIVADNDRQLWATKPGKHWAAALLLAARTTQES